MTNRLTIHLYEQIPETAQIKAFRANKGHESICAADAHKYYKNRRRL